MNEAVPAEVRLSDGLGADWWLAREMSEDQMRSALYRLAHELGGQAKLAARLGVQEGYLSEVMRGIKAPGASITEPMGLERVVMYRARGA